MRDPKVLTAMEVAARDAGVQVTKTVFPQFAVDGTFLQAAPVPPLEQAALELKELEVDLEVELKELEQAALEQAAVKKQERIEELERWEDAPWGPLALTEAEVKERAAVRPLPVDSQGRACGDNLEVGSADRDAWDRLVRTRRKSAFESPAFAAGATVRRKAGWLPLASAICPNK
jgi:hypothetical protein